MILNVDDDDYLENPDADTVRTAIIGLKADQFAVLNRGEQEYVQTYHNEDGSFQLEFRAGSADEHYAVDDDNLTVADVVNVFEGYLANQTDWKGGWTWEKVAFDDDFEGDLTADNAFLLGGEEYRRIAVGDEQDATVIKNGRCTACGVKVGEFHDDDCELEECPRCHGRLLQCDCE